MPENCVDGESNQLKLVPYNNKTHHCCGNRVSSLGNRSLGDGCCGDKNYKKKTHICCDGALVDPGMCFVYDTSQTHNSTIWQFSKEEPEIH